MSAILIGALGMCCVLGAHPPVTQALHTLEGCRDIRSQQCLHAATILTRAGGDVTAKTRQHMTRMTSAGQVLALTVIDTNRQRGGTDALIKVIADPRLATMVRTMALSHLNARDARSERITQAMIGFLNDRDATIRAASARALGDRAHKESVKVLAALQVAARDVSPRVRAEALLGLGFAGVSRLGAVILAGLGDPDTEVRRAALVALRMVRYADAVGPLIEVLTVADPAIRRIASEALRFQTGENYGDDYALWLEWHRLKR